MKNTLTELRSILRQIATLHRELLEVCKREKAALVAADLAVIQETTARKLEVVEHIQTADKSRSKQVVLLALDWNIPAKELSLSRIVSEVDTRDPALAAELRAMMDQIHAWMARVNQQNAENRKLVEASIEHINQMKKNILGETIPLSGTYNPQGQRRSSSSGSRLISKEA